MASARLVGSDYELKTVENSQSTPSATKPLLQRAFGPLSAGSVRGSMFTLISTAIGAGCLALPGMMANSGIILHLIIMILVATIAYLSVMAITRAAEHYDTYHFSELITQALGRTWGILIDIVIIIYIYGTVIAYQIMIGTFVPSILGSFGLNGDTEVRRDVSMVIVNAVVIIPLGMLRNLSALRYASIVSIVSLVLIAVILVAELRFFNHHYSDLNYFHMDLSVFSTFAVTLYAFVCHCNVPIVYNEMQARSVKRMSKAAFRAIFIVLCGYLVITIFGYLSVPKNSPALITQRKTPPGIHNDWVMVVARAIFCCTIIVAVPINSPPFRNSVMKICFPRKHLTYALHICITLFLLLTTLGIAIGYPNVVFLFSILGGFCASFLVLLIPGLLYYKTSEQSWKTPKNLAVLSISGILTLIGFTSVIISIVLLA